MAMGINWYTVAWIGWIGYFAIVEGLAIHASTKARVNGKGTLDTLSEHVWLWFGIKGDVKDRNTAWGFARRMMLCGFMTWLSIHFILGGAL
jgi:hypothetical protein